MANKRIDEPTGIETVGHEWDGIEELNNPLPRWWVITFWLTVLFAVGYIIAYPAIPLLHSGSTGLLHWSSRGQLDDEIKAARDARAQTLAAIASTPIEQIPANPDLLAQAIAGGRAAFRQNCVQCHGAGANGGIGYPSLKDDDWLWGGTVKDIEQTLIYGIRQPGVAETRSSLMPSFGRDGILSPADIARAASYVLSLSGAAKDDASARAGAAIFAANCAVCHGADAKGNRAFGAPNLTDKVWLYGGKREQVIGSITNAHAGVMPAWGGRLDPVTIKMLALYVHSLGGGEGFAPAPAAPPALNAGNAKP